MRATHPGMWGHSTAWASLLEDHLREEAMAMCFLPAGSNSPRSQGLERSLPQPRARLDPG